ncbi:mechanosensitive ion channel family protein [Patescibacteria group bacterium]|nr:mechanosensitive ion channel family protein [Patescibacteria group bacterium]
MKHKLILTGLIISAALTIPGALFAQEPVKTVDETILKELYVQYLKDPANEFILRRIEDERASIRDIIEEELQKIVTPPPEEAEIDPSEITKALDRQKGVIAALQDRSRERKVDLDLLVAEEKRFYLQPQTATGTVSEADKFRITKSHEGLLAKKVILEERISVLDVFLFQQDARLNKLEYEQRLLQFGILITIGKYLLILLAIWFIERTIRLHVLIRIKQSDRRYSVTKTFSSIIYIVTFSVLIGTIFAKNPGVLASLAIVGAGLAIALQDIVKDIVGWIVIFQNRLYSTGDRITIGGSTGEVIDIHVLRTMLLEVGIPPAGVLEHTGKVLSIPNAAILTQPITNHSTTSDFVNAEMRITVTFESNWKKAKQILEEVVNKETSQNSEREKSQQIRRTRMMYIVRQAIGPRVYTDIAADGIEFLLRFSVPLGAKWPVITALSEKIMERFDAEEDVELAYKTVRYYKKGEEK